MTSTRDPAAEPDKLLFTPGPLTTSATVKQAMLRDLGSRDAEFIDVVARVRQRLLAVAGVSQAAGYECVLLPGSGTYAIEAVVSSAVAHDALLLVAVNGAYGQRMLEIGSRYCLDAMPLLIDEYVPVVPEAILEVLTLEPGTTHVAVVHCETTTGVLNPAAELGEALRGRGLRYIVDAMSSFGAVPLDLEAAGVDFLIASSNKCLEGAAGLSFVIARREALKACEEQGLTLSLDLFEQWRALEETGQFRFTPPTQVVLALDQALTELEQEGGVAGRADRYRQNHETLMAGMNELGFTPYLPAPWQSDIITSFRYPSTKAFHFDEFYKRLSARGCVIYPGKASEADCFRIGTIGRIFPADVQTLLAAIRAVLKEMGVKKCGSRKRGPARLRLAK